VSVTAPPVDDAIGAPLLAKLGLVRESALSDDGDSFITLACRDGNGAPVVLKYVRADAPRDAYRRLDNETEMLRRLPTRVPLRVLRHLASGNGYLVTELDGGRLLVPRSVGDPGVVRVVADALACFQSVPADAGLFTIRHRESVGFYYLKVLAKHLLHLWPKHLSTATATRALLVVSLALPAIVRRATLSHGDFLPTNLLYHDDDSTVTFTDLESVAINHPLFDVLALFTMDERDIDRWDWQASFLHRYLERAGATLRLDPARQDFWDAYRGILIFFLVYRLNETLLNVTGDWYFGGHSKMGYVRAKVRDHLTAGTRPRAGEPLAVEVLVRARNVARLLSRDGFRKHVEHMRQPPAVGMQGSDVS
jgi:aminoglycoside phosphotransferase (APT) family kinase protein